jgi:glycosyltransferase involved in cell wall biosynthesis
MNAAEVEALRRRARERVERRYSWDAVATAYEDLFQSIMIP